VREEPSKISGFFYLIFFLINKTDKVRLFINLNGASNHGQKIRIHLADDHQVLIDGMRTLCIPFLIMKDILLMAQIFKIIANKADILVLDINMPEKDGIEVIKECSRKSFTMQDNNSFSYDDKKIIEEVMKLEQMAI
jgi:response regulator RpfG family c-di-GMP phosphodiesterase